MSGSSREKTCAVVSSALSSSVSRVMRSASWSPQTWTHSPQPLQRSDTKIEKRPPPPGVFGSIDRNIAGTFEYAIGSFAIIPVSSERPRSDTSASAETSCLMISLNGMSVFAFTDSFIFARTRDSRPAISAPNCARSARSVT